MKHIHAELMLQYAQDAMETSEPWELWEYSHASSNGWRNLDKMPSWLIGNEYRRKPKMISVTLESGEVVSWPEPQRTELEYGDLYFYFVPTHVDIVLKKWECAPWDRTTLSNGHIHLTEEAAKHHSNALFKINNQVAK